MEPKGLTPKLIALVPWLAAETARLSGENHLLKRMVFEMLQDGGRYQLDQLQEILDEGRQEFLEKLEDFDPDIAALVDS